MFDSINKTFGCCGKFLVAATKILFVVPHFVTITKPFFPCVEVFQSMVYFFSDQYLLCFKVASWPCCTIKIGQPLLSFHHFHFARTRKTQSVIKAKLTKILSQGSVINPFSLQYTFT